MNYNLVVLKWISQLKHPYDQSQDLIRTYIAYAPSYLVIDASVAKDPKDDTGITQWALGLDRIMDVLATLHAGSQLELETVLTLTKALSESWSNTHGINNTESAQEKIMGIVARLRKLLDEPDSAIATCTFKSHPIALDFL
ncbi:hypothetical protein CPB86DRAFT_629435 [Serendipita vermifera]|nr:hypothetical protein CPB86DRAFT_629435 [Serendipita vermifera]